MKSELTMLAAARVRLLKRRALLLREVREIEEALGLRAGESVDVPEAATPPPVPRGSRGLTARQFEAIRAIHDSIRDRGFPPTIREIGAVMGIGSTNGVSDHLRALERKGLLVHESASPRALRLTEKAMALIEAEKTAEKTAEVA